MKREQKQQVDFEAFEAVREERDSLEAKLKEALDVNEALKVDKSRLEHSSKMLRETNESQTKSIGNLTKKLHVALQERASFEDKVKAAARANDSLMEEVKRLQAQASEAHGQFQKRVEELAASCAAAMQEAEAQKDKVKAAEEDLAALKESNVFLNRRIGELSHNLDAAYAHREKLARELREKKTELSRVVEISNQFARERDSYREQYELYQHEYMLRGEVIRKLRKRLHKLKKKLKH